jgi:phosphonate transport system substrate-binding protein
MKPQHLNQLIFGIVSPLDEEKVRIALNTFCTVLGRRLGFAVKRYRAISPAALARALQNQTIQAAWVSPTLLVLSPELSEAVPLVCSRREGVSFYHSALFVPKLSNITTLAQLQGARIAWVAPSSAAGYIVPRLSLARRGIALDKLFSSEVFYESHLSVCRAVARGDAEVGATYAVFAGGNQHATLTRAGFFECPEIADARVLDISGPVPSDSFVVSGSVPLEQRTLLSDALRTLSEDAHAKEAMQVIFGTNELIPFPHAAHKELRSLIQMAKALGVLSTR